MLLSNPRVRSLVYWDNPRDSGSVCGSLLVCLLAVRYISLLPPPCSSPTRGCAPWCTGTTRGTPGVSADPSLFVSLPSDTSLSCRHHAPLQPEGALPGVLGQPA